MRTALLSLYTASLCLAAADGAKSTADAKNEQAPPKPEAGAVTGQLAKPIMNFGGVGAEVALADGLIFKVKKQLTRDVLKQRDGETIFVKITGPIYQGKTLEGAKKKTNGEPEMAPARLCEVADLRTKRLHLIIANSVLEGALKEAFPTPGEGTVTVAKDDKDGTETIPTPGYVGKSVAITMHPAPEGKRYKTFTVFELEEA
jgi:hypothetical protein